MTSLDIPPLCFITDPTSPEAMIDQSLAAAKGGAGWVQLRHKTLPDAEFADLARTLKTALEPLGTKLVINDRVEVAIAVKAPVLHIGQSDGDPADIRRRIGPDMILGLSVETKDQISAIPPGVDYLGVGPIRATGSKPDHAAPIGLDGFAEIVSQTPLPCLAIGGITHHDAAAVKQSGGAGLAVISAISQAENMEAASRALLNAWRDA
ncbi:MAG: thiamine phosphate synthase [Rhodobacteraceae bacterium]|nr:thiamine phosphate synthase [Paracoccaceae bacterium]